MADKNPNAVALGRLGGRRGGPARAKSLTSDERSRIARQAAGQRWCFASDESLLGMAGQGKQVPVPKWIHSAFLRDRPTLLRLPKDLDYVVVQVLKNGTPKQKAWLVERVGREVVVQCVRRARGSMFKTSAEVLEWVSRSTAWRWAKQHAKSKSEKIS